MSFPHVGLQWPNTDHSRPRANLGRNADFEVHRLFAGVRRYGVATIEAVYSRLVVDLNRASDDISTIVVPDHPAPRPRRRPGVDATTSDHGHRWDRPGRGVVWAAAVAHPGRSVPVLDQPLSYAQFDARIRRFHEPYYRALDELLRRRRDRFGYAILIDGHSMPGSVGVDVVLGTLDGTTCNDRLRQHAFVQLGTSSEHPQAPRLSVRVDDPYRGGEVIRANADPLNGIHSFQIEISRRLYMDEQRLLVFPVPEPLKPPFQREPTLRAARLRELVHRLHRLIRGLANDSIALDLAAFESAAQ